MRWSILLALGVCLMLMASSKAAPTQPEPATEEEMDRQIGDMLQKLEKAKNLNPREKRAVNVLSGLLGGGGGGGNLLNELNKGPTYSQLLGSGGGFNKAGLLSGFLGSSSGTAIINRRPLVSVSLGGGAGIVDDDPEAVALRFNIDQQNEHNPLDLGGPQGGLSAHLAIPIRGPLGLLLAQPPPPPPALTDEYDAVDEDDVDADSNDDTYVSYDDAELRANSPEDDSPISHSQDGSASGPYPPEALELKPSGEPNPPEGSSSYGTPYSDPEPSGNRNSAEASDHRRDPIASRRPRKQRGGRGGRSRQRGNGGASASASADFGGADASAGAAAGGGSDSGSILSLVTPLLGSSSAGAAGGGTDGGASVGLSLGGGAGGGANAADLWRETMTLHYRIKSFIFRKLAQLLGTSSGSPQAG